MFSKPVYKRNPVLKAFKNKGFKEVTGGKHTVLILLDENNQDTNIKTSIINQHSGPAGDLKISQLKDMASDIGLIDHIEFFSGYIECKNGYTALLTQLRETGVIP
jgi:hypothetical protein